MTGGCLCGAVRYRVDGPLGPVVACHCGQCRKMSGNIAAFTGAARTQVTIEGEVAWYVSSPEARRGFCGVCGSSLFWEALGSGRVSITAGTVDAPTGLQLRGHIFVADKGDYYTITDELPQAAGGDLDLTAP